MKTIKYITLVMFSLLAMGTFAQEVETERQVRTSVELSKKLYKGLKVEFAPEIRWDESRQVDKFLLNGQVSYKPFKFLSVAACYRYIGNNRQEKETEYLHRYQFSTSLTKKMGRWKPGLRLSYTNFTDQEEDAEFLRYKGFLSYNIRKSPLTPEVAVEAFYHLDNQSVHKYRYKLGFEYKLMKNVEVDAAYKFDYYMNDFKNRHIADVALKIKF